MADLEHWYEEWFDSPYYHCLYQHRDEDEAVAFLDKLLPHLKPSKGSTFLDMACGRGRHASYIGQLGYRVHGIDLSPNNIEFARNCGMENATFGVLDMRGINQLDRFDYILNLHTSFGYFEKDSQNVAVLNAVKACLKKGGTFVLDYLNPNWVINHLIPVETKTVNGMVFQIKRECHSDYVVKVVEVMDNGKCHRFREYVKLYSLDVLKTMIEQARLMVVEVFGDYELKPYNPEYSQRIILIAKLKNDD
jgi:SAM-dependent methyltransferase